MEIMQGRVSGIRFRNDETGYTVFFMISEQSDNQKSLLESFAFVAVGNIASISEGENLELSGVWIEHPEYGEQFRFEQSQSVLPEREQAIEEYLASGLIAGVGPATARNIVRYFGKDTFHIIQTKPLRLAEIKGISLPKAQQIAEHFLEQAMVRSTVIALQKYNISASQAIRIIKSKGVDCLEDIQNNPYCLIDDVEGIGFRRADQIAASMGIEDQSPFRIKAAINFVLKSAKNEGGHTCFPAKWVLQESQELLFDCERAYIKSIMDEMILLKELIVQVKDDIELLFLPYIFQMESKVARMMLELQRESDIVISENLKQELAALEREIGVNLDIQQRDAILGAFSSGVYIITGGPGTGKTTILNFILKLMEKMGLCVEMAAPTGRAAKRLSESTEMVAYTLHRLLGYSGVNFMKNQYDPLECDVLIVDEMSMVDLSLLYHLLKAMPDECILILVGDADQLPSVGAGNVLRDLISSKTLPVTRLMQVYRQGARSRIITNAHLINQGEMPLLDYTDDFAFQQIGNPNDVLQRILRICNEGKLGDPFNKIQVLSPTKKGVLGVINLNQYLQEQLNPWKSGKGEFRMAERIFRTGDKIMQIKNNYRIEWIKPSLEKNQEGMGVFNGDMGRIVDVDERNREIEILFDDERRAFYTYQMMAEVELAYAITIHKSQGSEFPIILIPLCDGPRMLYTRNLLYTAVTRARDQVVIIGWQESIKNMVLNEQERKRFSMLDQELKRLADVMR